MTKNSKRPLACSYNEWDPLEEVIVGNAYGSVIPGYESSFKIYRIPTDTKARRRSIKQLEAAQLQLDNLAKILKKEGVSVVRPKVLETLIKIKTPDFESFTCNSPCSRDILLVVGDEIIESPMSERYRYYQYKMYRELIKKYFKSGSRWTTAPRPELTDKTYHAKYNNKKSFDVFERPLLTEYEPCFDAASIMRFGKDIFYQRDKVTNNFGIQWLQRHLGEQYRLHEVIFDHIVKTYNPHHIDTSFVPLRPGLVLTNPTRIIDSKTRKLFKKNHWELIDAPEPSGKDGAQSRWISMNFLNINEHKVIVEETEETMIRLLESLGFEVITCPFKKVYPLGGSIHCCTTDIRRRGVLKSYFPSLD